MAKNGKKPKFLEKETPELLAMLKEIMAEEDPDIKKAAKIVDELISRQPADEGPISVDEALQSAASVMTDALNLIKASYENEVAMIEESDEDEETEETDDEEEEEKSSKKDKKSKKSKKPAKGKKSKKEESEDDEDETEEEEEEEDDDGEDYSDWATKDLKKECRTRGIKVTKGMSKADMVKALEADDKE